MKTISIPMHDGAWIEAYVQGEGPAILLPVNPIPFEGAKAEELRAWGVDPALGRKWMNGLSDRYRVVAFDYEGHAFRHPKPETLTPDAIASDFLAVMDAAGAETFAYYGYSWLALCGLQLAIRTGRLSALVMGGVPSARRPVSGDAGGYAGDPSDGGRVSGEASGLRTVADACRSKDRRQRTGTIGPIVRRS